VTDSPTLGTSLGTSTADSITVQGYDLCNELIGKVDFGDMAFLLVAGRLPAPAESTMFNAVLVTLADHGLTPIALAARLTYTGAPESLQGALASGLLGAGNVFLGIVDGAARMLQEGVERAADSSDAALRQAAQTAVSDFRQRRAPIPGLGHPIHRPEDPRTTRLYALAEEVELLGPHLRLLRYIADETRAQLGKALPINAAGTCGAIVSDLGFHWSIARGFALVSRSAGLVGHLWEETQRPIGRAIWELAEREVPYVQPERNEG
jgi:citrate synthase